MMWSTLAGIVVVSLLLGLAAAYDLAIRYTHR